MEAVISMTAAALLSKNRAIDELQAQLREAQTLLSALASNPSAAQARALQDCVSEHQDTIAGGSVEEEPAEDLVDADPVRELSQSLHEAREHEAELMNQLSATQHECTHLREHNSELAALLKRREQSYCALLETVEEYVTQSELGPSASPPRRNRSRAPSAAPSPVPAPPPAGPTPEKLAYWSQRLHRAARLRTSRPASPSPSRAEEGLTPASSPGTSGDEVARWHTPASALAPRAKAHPEESATSPSSLIRARRRYATGESSGASEAAEGGGREQGKGPALARGEENLAERLAEVAV